MPRVPTVVIAAVALVVAAVALFFLPQLLGVGTGDPEDGVGGVPTVGPSASVAPSPTPSATPAPTPVIYIVKAGDTLSRIATAHEVSMEELLAANPNITNPDTIAIGDPIVIPVGPVPLPSELQGSSAEPAASPSP
jgi:LysM repeat protein